MTKEEARRRKTPKDEEGRRTRRRTRRGVGEIDNLPIGPGGAADVDDETRPTDLTPPTRRQTAGIITPRQGKGDSADYSGTAMGAFWGRLGARQGEKARSTCLVIPPRSVVELQNLTLAAAFRWGMGNGMGGVKT